jgi:hypothetical protein
MSKVAYFVEGKMEQLIIQQICPGSPVRMINCNGDGVAIEAIARRVASLGRMLRGKVRIFVVIFDREGRTLSSEEIALRFLELLKAEGFNENVVVGIPDRMIENWILADYKSFCRNAKIEFNGETAKRSFDGCAGEAQIKKLLPKGVSYVKTLHGVEWFIKSRSEVISNTSPSFRSFADRLTSLKCNWLQDRELFAL